VSQVEQLPDREALVWRAESERLPAEAIAVLHGMLQHLVDIEESAASFSVTREANGADLLCDHYDPPHASAADFPVAHRESSGIAPPMSIVIAFVEAVPPEARPSLQTEMEVWAELLNGGYPFDDDPLGSSGIAAVTVSFVNPRMAVFATDGCRFGQAAIVPLIRLLARWHRRYRIEHLSIE